MGKSHNSRKGIRGSKWENSLGKKRKEKNKAIRSNRNSFVSSETKKGISEETIDAIQLGKTNTNGKDGYSQRRVNNPASGKHGYGPASYDKD